MSNNLMRRIMLRSGAVTAALAVVLGSASVTAAFADNAPTSTATSTAAPATTTTAPSTTTKPVTGPVKPAAPVVKAGSSLTAVASFDKAAYTAVDQVRIKVTVTNTSDRTVYSVSAAWGSVKYGNLYLQSENWGDLRPGGWGVNLAPGQSATADITSVVVDVTQPEVSFSASFPVSGEPTSVTAVATAKTLVLTSTVSGGFFHDDNGDGKLDPGEGIAGVTVHFDGGNPHRSFDVVTGADGRFSVPDVPYGSYSHWYHDPSGWVYSSSDGGQAWVVDGTANDSSHFYKGVRPVSDVFHASVRFLASTYAPGDRAHLAVKLTNDSDKPLTSITAFCSGPGDGNEIADLKDGWGDLGYDANGVTVPAHGSYEAEVTSTVPDGALLYGRVVAYCDFAPNGQTGAEGWPRANAAAKVPGKTSAANVHLIKFGTDTGIANTKVALLDVDNHAVVARAVTDNSGNAAFKDVPAGAYHLYVVGPWKYHYDGPMYVRIVSGYVATLEFELEPGPDQPDPAGPTPPPTTSVPVSPVGQAVATPPDELANTGASVVALAIAGLGVLMAGAGLVLFARRRVTR